MSNMVVTGIVTGDAPAGMFEVNGVRMSSTAPGVRPGDLVLVAVQADPVIIARFPVEAIGPPPDPVDPPPDPNAPLFARPPVPPFNASGATVIGPSDNMARILAERGAGQSFRVSAGIHRVDNVRIKGGTHIRLDQGAVLDGTGIGYCFRPASETSNDVVITGQDGPTKPIIRNYGKTISDSNRQGRTGAIQGQLDDTLAAEFRFNYVNDWFIHNLHLDGNGGTGVFIGDRFTLLDLLIENHLVTGVAGNRVTGGLVKDCDLYHNALNPSTGALANGGAIKLTWHNGGPGRTTNTQSTTQPKQRFAVSTCFITGAPRLGSSTFRPNHAVWFDLDCQDGYVEHNEIEDHRFSGTFYEGCNNGEAAFNTYRRIEGHSGYGQNFANGAMSSGESTNIWFHDNVAEDCNRVMMQRLSNRTADWLSIPSGQSFGIPQSQGGRGGLLNSKTIPTVDGQSNIWTGANRWTNNRIVRCQQVQINEGSNQNGQIVQGQTPLDTIDFHGNDYSESPSIRFYNASSTALTLAQWRAAGYDTVNP